MEKICHDWKHLLDKDFTNGKYWNDFAENAQNASVEIKIVKSYKDAIADILKIAKATDAKMIAGVGADECEELADVYVEVNKSFKVYTDKWGIVSLSDRPRSARTKDIMNFSKICDEDTLEEFRELLRGYNLTLEDVCTRAAARLVVDIMETLKSVKGKYALSDDHIKTKRRLW